MNQSCPDGPLRWDRGTAVPLMNTLQPSIQEREVPSQHAEDRRLIKRGKELGFGAIRLAVLSPFFFCFWKCCFVWKIIPWLFKPLLGLEYFVVATRCNLNRHASPEVPSKMSSVNSALLHSCSEAPKTIMWMGCIPVFLKFECTSL